MENTKVNVKIYGQEYRIAGDKPKDHILKVAEYVDAKMQQMSAGFPAGPISSLATLTAVNIADELFSTETNAEDLQIRIEQQDRDIRHYIHLWEEAKKSFLQFKDEAELRTREKNEMEQQLTEAVQHLEEIRRERDELESRRHSLENRNENLTARLRAQEEDNTASSEKLREMEEKYKELESSYFDIQMENIQLKGELDRYRKIVD